MSTITDITNLTVALTRRPEIPDVTASAIRMATMRAHHTDFFPRDLTSNTIPLVGGAPPSGMIDLPNISNSLVRLRSIKTIQMLSPKSLNFVHKTTSLRKKERVVLIFILFLVTLSASILSLLARVLKSSSSRIPILLAYNILQWTLS